MKNIIRFQKAGIHALKASEAGQRIAFTCPLCHEQAWAGKNRYNGHIVLYCPSCQTQIRQ